MKMRYFGPAMCSIAGILGCLLAGCSDGSITGSAAQPMTGSVITVTATVCGNGWRHPSPGLQTFKIHNSSTTPVDVSLTNAQTGGVYAEIEAVGSGTTRPMQANVGSGAYAFQCDASGGDELTGQTTLVPGKIPESQAVVPPNESDTLALVTGERDLIDNGRVTVQRQTSTLTADIEAGNLTAARNAWLAAHLSYERLGSAYGMFGDYDDEI